MLVHITGVNSKPSINKKTGERNMTKSGKPCFSVGILTSEYGDTWINNNFMPFEPKDWKGSEQELEISDTPYGKQFKLPARQNAYSTPKKADDAIALSVINTKLDQIIAHLSNTKRLDTTSDGKQIPFAEEDNW